MEPRSGTAKLLNELPKEEAAGAHTHTHTHTQIIIYTHTHTHKHYIHMYTKYNYIDPVYSMNVIGTRGGSFCERI